MIEPNNLERLAQELHLPRKDIERVVHCGAALVTGTADRALSVLSEEEFVEQRPDDDFALTTGGDAFGAHAPELVVNRVPIEASRAYVLTRARISKELDPLDGAYISLISVADRIRRLRELNAPEIIIRGERWNLQRTFERLLSIRRGEFAPEWQPYDELMTGTPRSRGCVLPRAVFATLYSQLTDALVPSACLVLPVGFLVLFPYASVVVGERGEILDAFPSSGLRPVSATTTHILLSSEEGCVARDFRQHRWVKGDLPEGLPRYVAVTICDVDHAIVADAQGGGYLISPNLAGNQYDPACTSADGEYAFDDGDVVVRAATAEPVLDMRFFEGTVRQFVRTPERAWRFLVETGDEDEAADPPELVVTDEVGRILLGPLVGVFAFSKDGDRLLRVTHDELQWIDLESGKCLLAMDVTPLHPVLAPPASADHSELWQRLLATFGFPAALVDQPPSEIRKALADGFWGNEECDSEAAILAAVDVARRQPVLSDIAPLTVRRGA